MSDKAIIVTEMPESCSKCKFMYEFYGVKKCQLLNVLKNGGKAIICVDKLAVARKECCPLISAEEHNKEIRDKAIEGIQEVVDSMEIYTAGRLNMSEVKMSVLQMQRFINRLKEIAEEMKEAGK